MTAGNSSQETLGVGTKGHLLSIEHIPGLQRTSSHWTAACLSRAMLAALGRAQVSVSTGDAFPLNSSAQVVTWELDLGNSHIDSLPLPGGRRR